MAKKKGVKVRLPCPPSTKPHTIIFMPNATMRMMDHSMTDYESEIAMSVLAGSVFDGAGASRDWSNDLVFQPLSCHCMTALCHWNKLVRLAETGIRSNSLDYYIGWLFARIKQVDSPYLYWPDDKAHVDLHDKLYMMLWNGRRYLDANRAKEASKDTVSP